MKLTCLSYLLLVFFLIGFISNAERYNDMDNSNNLVSLSNKPKLSNSIDFNLTNPKAQNYNNGIDGYYYGSYTFTYEVGKINTEIELFEFHASTGNSDALVIENYTDKNGKNHKQVIYILDNDTTSEVRSGHIFDACFIGQLELYFLMNASTIDSNTWFTLGFIQIFVNAGISLNLTGNKEIYFQNSTGNWSYLVDFNFNQWYHLKFDFDVDNDWYLITFNDIVYNLSFWENPSELNTFGSISAHLGINQSLYIDGFGLTSLVNYGKAFDYNENDNLETDLLLSFDNQTFMNDTIWYNVNNGFNYSIYGNHTFEFLPKGNYAIQVYCNDTNGIIYKSNIVYFTILREILPSVPVIEADDDDDDDEIIDYTYVIYAFIISLGLTLLLIFIIEKERKKVNK